MKIAKWNETTQQPYDIRDRYSVKAGNGVPYSDMASLERLGYYEYLPVALAEGEGLADVTHALEGGIIRQGGTVIGAEAMQAIADAEAQAQATQAQMDRHNQVLAMTDAYGQRVAILRTLLTRFGMDLPIKSEEAYQAIEDGIARELLADAQLVMVPLLRDAYDRCREVMTDDDIAAVWSIVKGA